MTSLIYDTGTVTVEAGSDIITGDGTGWAAAALLGGVMTIEAPGNPLVVKEVTSDSEIIAATNWTGQSGTFRYAIARTFSDGLANASLWTMDWLGDLSRRPWGVGVIPNGRGTLAQRNALNPMPHDDYCWLRVEVGQPLEFYFRVAGQWQGPYALKGEDSTEPGPPGQPGDGFEPAGAWAVGTPYSKNDLVSFGPRSFVSRVNGNVGHEPPNSDTDDAWWQFVPAAVGPANVLTIGTVSEGPADAQITGTSPGQQLDLTVPRGLPGLDGYHGWTPILAVVADGPRYVQEVVGWTGGTGAHPPSGLYVGSDGFVAAIGDAVNIRGASGAGTGDIVGPSSANDGEMALFDGITGKLIRAGGVPKAAAFLDVGTEAGTVAAGDDARFTEALRFVRLLNSAGEDLNDVVDVGWYAMNTNAGATAGTNYPDLQAGVLQVFPSPANNVDVIQRYTTYRANGGFVFERVRSSAGSIIWGPWRRFVTDNMVVTTSADGLMSSADKVKLNSVSASANQTNVSTVGAAVAAANANASPAEGDVFTGVLSGGATLFRSTWANIKAALKTYFDALYVPVARTLTAGTGLTGGGNLSANRTVALNAASVASLAKADGAVQKANDAGLGGFTATTKNLGNLGAAVTISPSDGNIQHGTNNAAVTITAPSVAGVYTIIVEIVNSATAGAVTLSGFTKTDGDAFTTTSGEKFQLHIAKTNSAVTATVKALQ